MQTITYNISAEQWLTWAIESIPSHIASSTIIFIASLVILWLLCWGWAFMWNKKYSPHLLFTGIVCLVAALSLTMKDSLQCGTFFNSNSINLFLYGRDGAVDVAKRAGLEKLGKTSNSSISDTDPLTTASTDTEKTALGGDDLDSLDISDSPNVLEPVSLSSGTTDIDVPKSTRDEYAHAQFLLSLLLASCLLLLLVVTPLLAYKDIEPIPAAVK